MTMFPDPAVRLRDAIQRLRGMDPDGNFTRVVRFPQIIKANYPAHYFKRWGIPKPLGAGDAYVGIIDPRTRDFIHDPMLAYQVDLIRYGYEEMDHYTTMREGRDWNPPEPNFPTDFEAPEITRPLRECVTYSIYKGSTDMRNRLSWPTFGVGPRGYRDLTYRGEEHFINGTACAYLAAIQFGAGTLKHYDNEIPDFRPDDSEQRVAQIRELILEGDNPHVVVVEDSGWEGRSGGRSITDYTRYVTFEQPPLANELRLYCEMLSLDNCPGWTGVNAKHVQDAKYRFTTTMDSSG